MIKLRVSQYLCWVSMAVTVGIGKDRRRRASISRLDPGHCVASSSHRHLAALNVARLCDCVARCVQGSFNVSARRASEINTGQPHIRDTHHHADDERTGPDALNVNRQVTRMKIDIEHRTWKVLTQSSPPSQHAAQLIDSHRRRLIPHTLPKSRPLMSL